MLDIDRLDESVTMFCDCCDTEEKFQPDFIDGFADFYHLAKLAKEYGWTIRKEGQDWCHYCPDCKP